MQFSARESHFPVLLRLGFVPGLAAPKIPEGEKVDFDVSSVNSCKLCFGQIDG